MTGEDAKKEQTKEQDRLLLRELCDRQTVFEVTLFDHNKVQVKVSTADGREHTWPTFLDNVPEVVDFVTAFVRRKEEKADAVRFFDLLD